MPCEEWEDATVSALRTTLALWRTLVPTQPSYSFPSGSQLQTALSHFEDFLKLTGLRVCLHLPLVFSFSRSWGSYLSLVLGHLLPYRSFPRDVEGTQVCFVLLKSFEGHPAWGGGKQDYSRYVRAGLCVSVSVDFSRPEGEHGLTLRVSHGGCALPFRTFFPEVLHCSCSWAAAAPAQSRAFSSSTAVSCSPPTGQCLDLYWLKSLLEVLIQTSPMTI